MKDDVVSAVCDYLEERRWAIVNRALATQHGDDIVAKRPGRSLRVEAKGEGSSKAGTARYGKAFSSGQVHDHVAKAVFRALSWSSSPNTDELASVAFPDNRHHRERVESVAEALSQLGIGVFWVKADRSVTLQAPWSQMIDNVEPQKESSC